MTLRRIVLIGNHTPRECGIATFTADLAEALAGALPATDVRVVAMNDGQTYAYPPRVWASLDQQDLDAYSAVAGRINAWGADAVCVQHEFGIYGGAAGSYLLSLLRRLDMPVVTTLHTVLEHYTAEQQAVIEELAAVSARLVVMSQRAVELLVAQGVARAKISLVPHGIPSAGHDHATEKARLGFSDRTLVLTFGLLSPNKGIETAIRALPAVVAHHPQLIYLVLGATHPHLRAQEGERYREGLQALAAELGVAGQLVMDNRFVDLDELTRVIAAADVYLTPYLNREQITSGTLAYALGSGKATVSTPYWYAEELLAGGRGELVPFADPQALAATLDELLSDKPRRQAMEARALAYGVHMRWPSVAQAYAGLFESAQRARTLPQPPLARPGLDLRHLARLSDDTGLFQHATVALPNPHEGYTTDDNARLLQLVAGLPESPLAETLAERTLRFLAFALDPQTRRFRNFLGYDRRWLEAVGSENSQARAVRALNQAALHLPQAHLRATAEELLGLAFPALDELESPRAQALALVTLAERAEQVGLPADRTAQAHRYAARLRALLAAQRRPEWLWFEPYLSYSNAKLPHGLIAYGAAFGDPAALQDGLDTLAWLEAQQSVPGYGFWPVGSERVYRRGEARPLWDGQPIEVHATVAADLAAYRATGEARWLELAARALDWLLGRNPLGARLYDPATGGCRDGLHRNRVNDNQGAESTLALWLSVSDLERAGTLDQQQRLIGD